MAFVSFLCGCLECFHVILSFLINDEGKSNDKKEIDWNCFLSSFPTFAVYYCIAACCCHALLLTCMLTCTLVFSSTFVLACSLSLSASLAQNPVTVLLHLRWFTHPSHSWLFSQCFHTLNPFKSFVLYFFFVLHFTLSVSHMFNLLCSITGFLGTYLQCCLAGVRAAIVIHLW